VPACDGNGVTWGGLGFGVVWKTNRNLHALIEWRYFAVILNGVVWKTNRNLHALIEWRYFAVILNDP